MNGKTKYLYEIYHNPNLHVCLYNSHSLDGRFKSRTTQPCHKLKEISPARCLYMEWWTFPIGQCNNVWYWPLQRCQLRRDRWHTKTQCFNQTQPKQSAEFKKEEYRNIHILTDTSEKLCINVLVCAHVRLAVMARYTQPTVPTIRRNVEIRRRR